MTLYAIWVQQGDTLRRGATHLSKEEVERIMAYIGTPKPEISYKVCEMGKHPSET